MEKDVKILISNLHPDVETEELQELVEAFGEVISITFSEEADLITDTYHAIVTMAYEDEAEDAAENLHGKRFLGLRLEVDIYEEEEDNDQLTSLKRWEEGDEEEDDLVSFQAFNSKTAIKKPRGFRYL